MHDDLELLDKGEHDPVSLQSSGDLSGQALAETLTNSRKEATRRQRIEAEQRRREMSFERATPDEGCSPFVQTAEQQGNSFRTW
jgi:hypothetical protein